MDEAEAKDQLPSKRKMCLRVYMCVWKRKENKRKDGDKIYKRKVEKQTNTNGGSGKQKKNFLILY